MSNIRNKGNRILGFVNDYTSFDLETTGRNILEDEIIEIGAVKVRDGEIIDTFSTLVKPRIIIPDGVIKIHGITNEMVADAPLIDDVIESFLDFIGDDILLGHNIATFDINMMYDAVYRLTGKQLRNNYIDTLYLSRRCLHEISDYKLSTICDYYDVSNTNAHRALADSIATHQCYKYMSKTNDIDIEVIPCSSSDRSHHTQYSDKTVALQELKLIVDDITDDNVVSMDEFLSLGLWISNHEELEGNYPFDVIYEAIAEILEDGIVEAEELDDLVSTLKKAVSPVESAEHECISNIVGKHCVITGAFEYGSREEVQDYIREHGGIVDKSVTKKTNYVVVGSYGSGDWSQANYGNKIKTAIEYNEKYSDKGVSISILQESDFFEEVNSCMNDQLSMFDNYDWKSKTRQMLEELEKELELPDGSLLLLATMGKKTEEITSHSVVIYEQEWPPIPNAKMDEKRNSVVLRVVEVEIKKENKTVLEVIINKDQFDSLYKPDVISVIQRDSEPDVIRMRFEKDSSEFVEYIKENTKYCVRNYTSKEASFGCCSRFVDCSDAKKCLHPNKLFAQACYYKHNLERGRIFYGKNKNVDEKGDLIESK